MLEPSPDTASDTVARADQHDARYDDQPAGGPHPGLLPALLVVTLLSAMDQTVVATALPAVVADVGGAAHLGWVFAGYTLAMTLSMPVAGRLADLRGRRRLFLASIAAFVASSTLCGLAGSMEALVALRVLQGLAGGGVAVLSQAVVADAVPARDRAHFLAPIGLVFATSSVVAPLLGGTLTDTVGWRWIFFINLPIGGFALLLAHRSVPRPRVATGAGRVDVLGTALFAVAVTSLVLLAADVSEASWSPVAAALLALTLVGGGLFAARMVLSSDPLIPVGVLRNRTVAVASALGLVLGVCVFGLIGYLPTVVQTVLGLRPTQSGAILLALVLGMTVSISGTARWITRTGGYRRLPTIGCLIGAAATALLGGLDSDWSVVGAGLVIAMLGLGAGFFMQVTTIIAQDAVADEHVGSATATVSLTRELGVTVGAAAIGAALAAGASGGSGGSGSLEASVVAGLPAVSAALTVVMLAGAVVSLLLPARRLGSTLAEDDDPRPAVA